MSIMNEFKPLFICGMSRGGTTWLGHCLNEHPQVAVFGESLYWGRNYLSPNEEGGYTNDQVRRALQLLAKDCKAFLGEGDGNLKQIDRDQWKSLLDRIEIEACSPADLFERVCELVREIEGADFVIEKTPHHVNWIPRIFAAYPNAKFAVMVRDPYGFMLSYKHQGDRKSEFAKRDFQALYHPLACAYMWKGYMNSALRMHQRFEAQTHIVRFEALRVTPDKCWNDVLHFFEVPFAPLVTVSDRNSSFTGAKRILEPIDMFWMNLLAGRAIQAGGYSKNRSGVTVVEVLGSICGLIPWGFRAAKLLKSRVPGGLLKYFLKLGK
jgi:hypothetical protein